MEALLSLREFLIKSPPALMDKIQEQSIVNPWFTPQFCLRAIQSLSQMLQRNQLIKIKQKWQGCKIASKKVGLVCAGNIPLVGFHDMLMVFMSPHRLEIKYSHKDNILFPYIVKQLIAFSSSNGQKVRSVDKMKEIDALITSGSNHTAVLMEDYFPHIPKLIRKHRSTVAILNRDTSLHDLRLLADDIFLYFGLGCRSVSKIYLPESFEMKKIIDSFQHYHYLLSHHKYANNYTYHKTIFQMQQVPYIDCGFFLLYESHQLAGGVSVIFFQRYKDIKKVAAFLNTKSHNIQSWITSDKAFERRVDFGKSQAPGIDDFADGIDTVKFLQKI